ncbi:MAG: glutamate racemase [Dehalococcoidia bacterium]
MRSAATLQRDRGPVPRDTPPLIGFFDSGIGGLAVLTEVARRLPRHRLLYFADAAHFPYGDRTDAEIIERSHHAARFLSDAGAEAIVVACNTASTLALTSLRRTFAQPFIGVVPAVKPAARLSRAGRIAILATEGTLRSRAFDDLVESFAANIEVIRLPASGLADQVECGALAAPDTLDLLERCLAPAWEQRADVLVLGCTHYSFLRPSIERLMGPAVTVLDCAEAVARQVVRVTAPWSATPPTDRSCQAEFITSGEPRQLLETLARLQAAGATLPLGPVHHNQAII